MQIAEAKVLFVLSVNNIIIYLFPTTVVHSFCTLALQAFVSSQLNLIIWWSHIVGLSHFIFF